MRIASVFKLISDYKISRRSWTEGSYIFEKQIDDSKEIHYYDEDNPKRHFWLPSKEDLYADDWFVVTEEGEEEQIALIAYFAESVSSQIGVNVYNSFSLPEESDGAYSVFRVKGKLFYVLVTKISGNFHLSIVDCESLVNVLKYELFKGGEKLSDVLIYATLEIEDYLATFGELKIYQFDWDSDIDWYAAFNQDEAERYYMVHTECGDLEGCKVSRIKKEELAVHYIVDSNELEPEGDQHDKSKYSGGQKIIESFKDYLERETTPDFVASTAC